MSPTKLKNLVIVLASILFYSWGGPKYIFIIFASILLDFFFAMLIYRSTNHKKLFMIIALSINLGLLAYFKYFNFFLDNINTVLVGEKLGAISFMRVALPIGISFFTFHEMSYIIDVYRGVKPPMKNIVDYSLYILFFPQLIAGPIIRFNEISDQIIDRKDQETIDNKLAGFFRFIIGLAKKVLIANVIGLEADKIFAIDLNMLNTPLAWIGVLAYSFQIYFDFSGYSDMAIGIARMLGFVFPENFNNPYIAQSITEFWKRWHMTLSRWMRDYLYIGLGGNRVGKSRLYLNLWIVFLLSGLWHGAAWNFVIWGTYHGMFLIADRIFLSKLLTKIGKYPSIIITFLFVLIGWVFFRVENISQAFAFIGKMFSFNFKEANLNLDNRFYFILMLAAALSFVRAFKPGKWLEERIYATKFSLTGTMGMTILCVLLFVLSVGCITSSGFNPFIYFRF